MLWGPIRSTPLSTALGKGPETGLDTQALHHYAQLLPGKLPGRVAIFQLHPVAYNSYNIAQRHLWPDITLSPLNAVGEFLG